MRQGRGGWRTVVAWLAAAVAAAGSIATIWLLEAGTGERLFCLTLLLAGAALVGVPSGRPAFGVLASALLLGLIAAASTIKGYYLHSPLMLPDLHAAADPEVLRILLYYRRAVRKGALLVLAGVLALVLLWQWSGPSRWEAVQPRRRRWRLRLGASLAAMAAAALAAGPWGPFRGLYAIELWDFMNGAGARPIASFFLSLTRMRVVVPEHDAARAAAVDWRVPAAAPQARRPDILAVLEESTFPPRLLAVCDRPECDADMFVADARTVASGNLLVHTFGGATWTSEFAFLAGLPHTLFGPAGVYAPYNLAPRLRTSLPRVLKAQGYRTVAIYPVVRDFGNAANAYAAYGFDALYDAGDLKLQWESPDTEWARQVAEIWRKERANAGRAPLFVFALTMRQHGPHADPLASLPSPYDHPLFRQADAATNLALANYLARLHQSDAALKQLEALVLQPARPGLLVHFGDHQPSFDGIELQLPKRVPAAWQDLAYAFTYYMIKDNQGLPRLGAPASTPLDVAFLPGLLLQAAGLDPGPYFGANIRLRELCQGRFEQCGRADLLQSFYTEVFDRQAILAP